MKYPRIVLLALGASLASTIAAPAQDNISKEDRMTGKATGKFDVKMTPQAADAKPGDAAAGRFRLDKQYHGDLEATGLGEMLAARTEVEGSAGYVAIEKVSGRLAGRAGTFLLQHHGIMTRGEGKLSVVVIPDSATGELTGLTGTMTITITPDEHVYEFAYSLPAKP
jgi:hypothetical protein